MPNSMMPPSPSDAARSASFTSSSTESCATPGRAAMGRRTPSPCTTNCGHTSCEGTTCVSATRRRRAAVRRNRRMRRIGHWAELIGRVRCPRLHLGASARRRRQQCALRCYCHGARRIVQRLQDLPGHVVIVSNLDAERALTRCRHDVERVEHRAFVAETQSLESCNREQGRVDLFGEESFSFELVERPVHFRVAAGLDHYDLRAHAAGGETVPDPFRLPPRKLTATGAELQANRLANDSTRPETVCGSASMISRKPSSRAVSAVTGPMVAATNRPDVAAGRPMRSTKLRTVDDDVKVTASM